MKNKYIRFFISSTFSDFKIERNILVDVFDELTKYYALQDWQIEMVDLRWGINKEASDDNKTMQICKTELRRCQELSPKPNFIILHGDRYGWVPIPEIVPKNLYDLLDMSEEERVLFNNWYKLDTNELPYGVYVLQSKVNSRVFEYDITTDDFIYDKKLSDERWKEIEKSLALMFERNNCQLYGSSATEQEIELGALNVRNAKEHVIAYLRHMNQSSIPKELCKDFYDIHNETGEVIQKYRLKVRSLRERIMNHLSANNILEKDIDYNQYKSDAYKIFFREQIKQHIQRVIDNTIREYRNVTELDENQLHTNYAIREAESFLGREKELQEIDDYLSKTPQTGVWYIAPSGAGKTALLAKIVDKYHEQFDVICRFCGVTTNSVSPEELYSSIKEDLKKLNISKERNKYIFNRPVLLIIDSIDRVNSAGANWFDSMKWVERFFNYGIYVFISTTPEVKYNIELPKIKKKQLSDMGEDSISFVMSCVNQRNRILSNEQHQQLKSLVEKSKKSALYLQLLGNILSQVRSWEDISQYPTNLQELVVYYLISVVEDKQQEWVLVKDVLSWYAISNIGLADSDIKKLLSHDEKYIEKLKLISYHDLGCYEEKHTIPSIVWIRLKYDLQPLLRSDHKDVGMLTTFFHQGILSVIKSFITKSDDDIYAGNAYLLHEYFSSLLPQKHALLEVVPCLCKACNHKSSYQPLLLKYMSSHMDYIINQKLNNPETLMLDYDWAISSLNNLEYKKQLLEIKHQLHQIHNTKELLDVKYALHLLPPSSALKKAIDTYDTDGEYLPAKVVYNPFSTNDTLYVTSKIGNSPCMSQDGKIVASLIENNYCVYIENLEDNTFLRLVLQDPGIEIKTDDRIGRIVVRTDLGCIMYDVERMVVLLNIVLLSMEWMDLSADGNRLVIGESDGMCYIYDFVSGHEELKLKLKDIKHGKLSPSGRYLWYIRNTDNMLCRFILDKNAYECLPQLYENGNNPYKPTIVPWLESIVENLQVISCSDILCMLADICIHFCTEHEFVTHTLQSSTEDDPLNKHKYVHRDKLGWVGNDGTIFLENQEGTSINLIGYIEIQKVRYINGDLTIALLEDGSICKLTNRLSTFMMSVSDGSFFSGDYNLSCDYSGSQVMVSLHGGSGAMGGYAPNVLRVDNDECYILNLNEKLKTNFLSFPAHAITPDGECLFISAHYDGGIYCINLRTKQVLWNLPKLSDNCEFALNMMFTSDGNYAMITSGQVAPGFDLYEPSLYVVDRMGNCLFTKKSHTILSGKQTILTSLDNRYAIIENNIIDIVAREILYKEDVGTWDRYLISTSTNDVFISTSSCVNNKIYHRHYNLTSKKLSMLNEAPIAVSASGRYHFYICNNDLYICKWLVDNERQLLCHNIVKVIPTYNDRYIYVVNNQGHIILYDVTLKVDVQIASLRHANKKYSMHLQNCSQGLIAYDNKDKELFVFTPDKQLKVNVPAVTTFVRRYKLETQELQAPTAICPICGKLLKYDQFKPCGLKNYDPENVYDIDWDSKLLYSHRCYHCTAELAFNPYIL